MILPYRVLVFLLVSRTDSWCAFRGFLSGYWKWQHPYFTWFVKSISLYIWPSFSRRQRLLQKVPESALEVLSVRSGRVLLSTPTPHQRGAAPRSPSSPYSCAQSLSILLVLQLRMQISAASNASYRYALSAFLFNEFFHIWKKKYFQMDKHGIEDAHRKPSVSNSSWKATN